MIRTVLPASVMPDVLIANGTTYLALPLPQGLVIYATNAQTPLMVVTTFPPGNWPRFFNHATGVLVAYKTADDNALSVANVSTGGLDKTGIPAFWNSPIAWNSDGTLATQATNDAQVWAAVWPTLPAPPAIRQGSGTGIAQWIAGTLQTWDEMGVTVQPVILFGAQVSQANQGGVAVVLGSASGVLDAGQYSNNPRPALAADGSLSFVYWSQDGHGATATVLYQGVTAADLGVSLPPIAPFTEGKILASYDSGGAKGDNGTVEPEHFWLYRFADGKTFDYFDLENGEPVTSHPCIAYSDIASATQAITQLRDGDALSFDVYPTAGEPLETLRQRALGVIHQAVDQGLRVLLVGCAWNRLGTLSDQLVIDGMGLVRELADSFGVIGVEWFGIDRGTSLGYFKGLFQEGVDRFSSPGWPAWPVEVPVAASVTITSYGPTTGQAPLSVVANFAYDGPVMSYAARYRLLGSPSWMVDAINPVSDSNHTYHFPAPATYEIGLAGLDGMGRVIAETGMQRLVVVSAAPSDAEQKALAQLDAALLGMKAAVDNMHSVLGK